MNKIAEYKENIEKIARDRWISKSAEEDVFYHASPVQGIKRFRRSQDTSGNNKGKIIFASKKPDFAAAFGTKWHDAIARLNVDTSDAGVPTNDNFKGTTLKYTTSVDLDKPCSMYKLKGNFKELRYKGDLEQYTNKTPDILSEEKFKSYRDMANHYGLHLEKVTKNYILEKLKSKKSSNFEKVAWRKKKDRTPEYIEKIKKAGNQNKMVMLHYTDKKGIPSIRAVEPYKISNGDVWAYDPSKKDIRRFKGNQISAVKIMGKKYEPRWPVEMDFDNQPNILSPKENPDEMNKDGKIPTLENAFKNPIEKKVAYMIATSHEYKKPNVEAALSFVKNYKWERSLSHVNDLQGINKPVIQEKVDEIAKSMGKKKPSPLVTVNQLHGLRPQTPGKKLTFDGHHRLAACKQNGHEYVPIYKGTYTGNAEKSSKELREKAASEIIDEMYWSGGNGQNSNV